MRIHNDTGTNCDSNHVRIFHGHIKAPFRNAAHNQIQSFAKKVVEQRGDDSIAAARVGRGQEEGSSLGGPTNPWNFGFFGIPQKGQDAIRKAFLLGINETQGLGGSDKVRVVVAMGRKSDSATCIIALIRRSIDDGSHVTTRKVCCCECSQRGLTKELRQRTMPDERA